MGVRILMQTSPRPQSVSHFIVHDLTNRNRKSIVIALRCSRLVDDPQPPQPVAIRAIMLNGSPRLPHGLCSQSSSYCCWLFSLYPPLSWITLKNSQQRVAPTSHDNTPDPTVTAAMGRYLGRGLTDRGVTVSFPPGLKLNTPAPAVLHAPM